MKRSLSFVAAASSLLTLGTSTAFSSSLPAIKVAASNKVPECTTPGRLMAFLAQRNPKLDPRFSAIATAYMRHGEQLELRWDYAFFQMMLETGSLSYTRDGTRPGDVKPKQNNFAGLGATGKGAPGESFSTVDEGVKAHLQHLVMYAGERVDDPVADRTRKVQEWGVLTNWHKGFKRPITFSDLGAKWAPGSRGYASNIETLQNEFKDGFCSKPDPKPELVQEARSGRTTAPRQASAKPADKAPSGKSQGAELARQALERARSEGDTTRSALGARPIVPAQPYGGENAPAPGFTVLNEPRSEANSEEPAKSTAATLPPTAPGASRSAQPKSGTATPTITAAAAGAVAKPQPPAAAPEQQAQPGKCRVYTASYGGQKAVIIRAPADQFTNFTVLDVNEGQEAREIDAYIGAYAKGGQKVGEFSSSNAALDKAFQLCPEG